MPIYTPRGIKIRIAVSYAFGLMTRLYPEVSPFRILKTTEGIESLPAMFAIISGIIGFLMQLPPLQIGLVAGIAQLLGVLINIYGFYYVPGLVALGTFFSYVSGYGIFLIPTTVVGFVFVGWQGVLAFFIGKFSASMISHALQFRQTSRYHKLIGRPITASEVHFFSAYRLHASRMGVTTDITLRDEEIEEDNWKPAFEAFVSNNGRYSALD